MINTDREFKKLVRAIASGQSNSRETVLEASGYLWDSLNWERLSESPWGLYLREHGVNNEVPDLALRAMYREQVLKTQE